MVITVKGTSSAITILTSTSTIESKKKAFTLLFFKEEYFIKQTLFLILVLSCFQVLMILLTNSMVINCNSNRYLFIITTQDNTYNYTYIAGDSCINCILCLNNIISKLCVAK